MNLYYIPESIVAQYPYQGMSLTQKNVYAQVAADKQLFAYVSSEDEFMEAVAGGKAIVSLTEDQLQSLIAADSIQVVEQRIEEPEDEIAALEPNELLPKEACCSIHVLSPIYSATNKFLGTGAILFAAGLSIYSAVPVALFGAACNFWVQYNYITKSATGQKSLDAAPAPSGPYRWNWHDETMALATVVSSIAEGASFAASVYLNADANQYSTTSAIALAAVALKFRQTITMQADGQAAFIKKGSNFADTYLGSAINLTQQFPPRYPFLIDFNSWVKDFLPTVESVLPAMAFNAFLKNYISNDAVCMILAPLVSTGEWYQVRGYSLNLVKHVQQLANTKAPLGFAHLVDIIIRLYNESIGNIVNGRIVNDAVGIVVPPAIWNLIIKIAGNFFTGYVGGGEVLKVLPELGKRLGIDLPDNFEPADPYVQPIVGAICAIAAVSQYKAGYDKDLRGLPVGIKPLLEKIYGGASITSWSGDAIKARFKGYCANVKSAPQRFFKVLKDAKAELQAYPCVAQAEDEPSLDLERGLRQYAIESGCPEGELLDSKLLREMSAGDEKGHSPAIELHRPLSNFSDDDSNSDSDSSPEYKPLSPGRRLSF